MCVARLPHRRTSGRLLSWHGWMEAVILLPPRMPRIVAELLSRCIAGMGLNARVTERAGRCLGVSELKTNLMASPVLLAWQRRCWGSQFAAGAVRLGVLKYGRFLFVAMF